MDSKNLMVNNKKITKTKKEININIENNKKENRKIKLTKKALKEALIEMLETTDIHKISITNLCKEADINRSTFYKYYGSQYDLLHSIEDDFIDILQTKIELNENVLLELLNYLKDNIQISKILLNEHTDYDFKVKLLELPIITNTIKENFSNLSSKELVYVNTFILSGGFEMIAKWINLGCIESPEEIAKVFNTLIQKFKKIV